MKKIFLSAAFLLFAASEIFCDDVPFFVKEKTDAPKELPVCEFVLLAKDGDTFRIGEGNQNFTSRRQVQPFRINRYETTYKHWYLIRLWAESNGYFFQNPGQQGSSGSRGKAPTHVDAWEPVTNISWYDAVVWCNAYSEFSKKTPCYYFKDEDGSKKILRDSSDTVSCDLCICDFNADGFRLPTETEWEYAARKTKSGFQGGNLASGQIDSNGKDSESVKLNDVAWSFQNARGTHRVGTAGTPFDPSAPPLPGSGRANGASIFDMSGNVLEWCWDWLADYSDEEGRAAGPEFGSERVMRGGSWNKYTLFLGAGDRYSFDPNEYFNYFGFRIATSSLR